MKVKKIIVDSINCNIEYMHLGKFTKPKNVIFNIVGKVYFFNSSHHKIDYSNYNDCTIINEKISMDIKKYEALTNLQIQVIALNVVYDYLYKFNTELYISAVQENIIKGVTLNISNIKLISYGFSIINTDKKMVSIDVLGSIDILRSIGDMKTKIMRVNMSFKIKNDEYPKVNEIAKEKFKRYIKKTYSTDSNNILIAKTKRN